MTLTSGTDEIDVDEAVDILTDIQPAIDPNDPEVRRMLSLFTRQMDRLAVDINEIFAERFIDSATGAQLDFLGHNVGVKRPTGEGDDKFRKRVQAGYIVASSTGTFGDIAQAAAALLDTDPANISIKRAKDTADPATAVVLVTKEVLNNSPFTNSEIGDLLGRAAVGGHRVVILQSGAFTWDDSNLGWGTEWGESIDG